MTAWRGEGGEREREREREMGKYVPKDPRRFNFHASFAPGRLHRLGLPLSHRLGLIIDHPTCLIGRSSWEIVVKDRSWSTALYVRD